MDTVAQTRSREVTPSRYLRLAAASAISLYAIVLTGALVRLTGSGLACESWPGCQEGAFFPAVGEHSTIEFGNRVVALAPILLSLLAWIAAPRTGGLGRGATWIAAGVFLGTIAQAPLGLLTIRLDLHPLMVGTHFLLALVVLAGAVALAVEAWGNARGRVDSQAPSWLRAVGLVLVVACGVLVVTGTLSTAAGPHPGDSAEIDRFWNLLDAVWWHVRATAAFGLSFLVLVAWLVRERRRVPGLLWAAAGLLVLLLLQMGVGEIQFRNQLPWWLVLGHVGLAAAVWAWTVGLVTALWRTPVPLVRH
ncbi:MAG: COX15/CtaA family protein [Gaiellaceae bacterium MAG52_C11]|nr:COX15/CtaA family protein [Candidatus Gaiellasilicea maunaloa]